MSRLRQRLSFCEAVDLLIAERIVEGRFSIGTNAESTVISIPAGDTEADKNGFFSRSDICRLISYARWNKRRNPL